MALSAAPPRVIRAPHCSGHRRAGAQGAMSDPSKKRARAEAAGPPAETPPSATSYPYWASVNSRGVLTAGAEFPAAGVPPEHASLMVKQYSLLDFKPALNTSSYVNVMADEHEHELMNLGARINIADQTIYPSSFNLHNDALAMVANLWNAPQDARQDGGPYPGAQTVGSTEACLLAGLALKFRWRKWRAARHPDAPAMTVPNLVISTCFQAAWEKLFKYLDVEPRLVQPAMGKMTLDADMVAAACDENTMGVVCILGNHYSGAYDPVGEVSAALDKLNAEKDWQVGIHVDAASGGFVAPFQAGVPTWDFRVPNVLSVSASGHKFGLSCCGTGWVVWRRREDLAEHVAISVSYLGGVGESYTLNFSRPATGSYVQLYKFLLLGREGYTMAVANQMATAARIRAGLKAMLGPDGKTPRFVILDNADTDPEGCLPVVCAMLNPALALPYDDCDLQHVIAERHWYISGYHMNFKHPITEATEPLFHDAPAAQALFRVVVKANLTPQLAEDLLSAMRETLAFLDDTGEGFRDMHRKKVARPERGRHAHTC